MDQLIRHAALNTLVVAIAGGFILTLLARKLRISAIVVLLAGGIILGPQVLRLVQPQSLQSVFSAIVSLAVAVILFEGGLTLDLRGYRTGSSVITRLLTLGVLITWLAAAISVYLIFALPTPLCLLGGSLVIVTGPTVVGPLLKRIKVQARIHSILHWEAVLIDPIGVFVAVLCYEWFLEHNQSLLVAHLALRLLSGIAIGGIGGAVIVLAFRRKVIPENLQNAFALVSAVLIFGLTEAVIAEAGLVSVTLAGFIVGWQAPSELKQIRQFKAEITDLLIGLLFVLLSARLQLSQFREFGWRGLLLVALVLLLVRPLNVLVCTIRSPLDWRERIFLGWLAPRGIVAASMASLFTIALSRGNYGAQARFLETFTYSVIVVSILLQGFSAGWVAQGLGLRRPEPTGWLIVNADAFGRGIARFIRERAGLDVLLLDTNPRLVAEAREENITAFCEDALNVELSDERDEYQTAGHLLALTDNSDLNELLCQRWSDVMGREEVHRWRSLNATATNRSETAGRVVFPEMLRPSIIAAEIVDRQASLTSIRCEEPPPAEMEGMPLLIARSGSILPVVETENQPNFLAGDEVLVLQRSTRVFPRSLEAGRVIDLPGDTLNHICEQMLELVITSAPKISRPDILKTLTDPQSLIPSLISHGVAVPHCYSPNIERAVTIVARLQPPLRVSGQDEPVQLVFLVISPAGDLQGHLSILGEIARFCSEPRNRETLMKFNRPEEVRRYLRRRALT